MYFNFLIQNKNLDISYIYPCASLFIATKVLEVQVRNVQQFIDAFELEDVDPE